MAARVKGRVLVTGATGAVGPAVVGALRGGGWEVHALVRGDAPPNVIAVRGDLRDHESLRRAAGGADAIVHMAGLLHLPFAGADRDSDFQALNVDATRVLVEAARGKRFVFFSSIAVYGCGGPFDERSPLHPETAYARTKAEAEPIVLAAGGTVLRLAAVYGTRMKGNYASLVRMPLLIGGARNHRTLVHDSDVARATLLALETETARGQIYNVTDGTTHELRDIIAAVTPFAVPVPGFIARLARVVPKARMMLDKYGEDVRVDGSKIQRELGFVPRADFREAWREAVRR